MSEQSNDVLQQMSSEFDLQDSLNSTNQEDLQSTNEEIKEEEVKVEEKKEDPFSVKFAALSKREKALKQRERDLERKFQEYEQRLAQSQPEEVIEKKQEVVPLEVRLRKDPLGTLQEFGFTYDKLAEVVQSDGKLPIDMQMQLLKQELEDRHQKELQAIREELQNSQKKSEEDKYQETINAFKQQIESFVNSNSETYELIQANDATDLVYSVIEQHHADTGRILTEQEAADAVEAHLYEEAQKLLKLKKLSPKQVVEQKPKTNSTTLSNNLTSQSTIQNSKRLTDEQSKTEAAKLIKWIE